MSTNQSPQEHSQPALKANIMQLLGLDLENSEKLKETLQQERSTLQQHDQQALPALVEQKDKLLAKLDQSAKLRTQWLQQLGCELSSKGWKDLITRQQDSKMLELWQALETSVTECRELNEINGRLIGRSQQSLTKLLNILRGNKAAPQLYGSDGNTKNRSESQCFTQA